MFRGYREGNCEVRTASGILVVLAFTILKLSPSADPPPVTAPGFPRVFSKVHNTETNQVEQLEFKQLRKDFWETGDGTIDYRNLIFDATFSGGAVLAKVVFRSYGKDVHAHLAARRMAPQLYGTSDVQGPATVVIMELLKGGWMTLFDYRNNKYRSGIPGGSKERLLKRLEEMLDCLEAGKMVHGDFRMANIMVKPGKEENAMLIDFDWAGGAEEAKYPVTRSHGFGYPGCAGGIIGAGHDRELYEKWKDQI